MGCLDSDKEGFKWDLEMNEKKTRVINPHSKFEGSALFSTDKRDPAYARTESE